MKQNKIIAERSDNAFVNHPDGAALQEALLTGIYSGDFFKEKKGKRVTQAWIAKQLGISDAAVSQAKRRLKAQKNAVQLVQTERARVKSEIIKKVLDPGDLPALTEQISLYHRLMITKAASFLEEIEKDIEKREEPIWRKLWLDAMKEVRVAIKDAIQLFGLVEDEVAETLVINMHEKVEKTIDFLQEHAPELVPKYVLWLQGDSQ